MPCRHLITSPEVIVVKVVGGFTARAGRWPSVFLLRTTLLSTRYNNVICSLVIVAKVVGGLKNQMYYVVTDFS
jgi:hypothetical protein